jgi:hypothetical protein
MNEYRLTATIEHLGRDEPAALALLEALDDLYPEAGSVVAQDVEADALVVTTGLAATDPWAASNLGNAMFAAVLARAGLNSVRVVDVAVSMVSALTELPVSSEQAPA